MSVAPVLDKSPSAWWPRAADKQLDAHFNEWVDGLELARLIDAPETVATLGRYAIVPIEGQNKVGGSDFPAGEKYILPHDVAVDSTHHQPFYMDTSCALGLTRKDRVGDKKLKAAVAAHVSEHGLTIKQIQGIAGQRSGLFIDFYWQDPLVRGWVEIGKELGAPRITIIGAGNNIWRGKLGAELLRKELITEGKLAPDTTTFRPIGKKLIARAHALAAEALFKNYGAVATRLGFDPGPDRLTDDWHLDLPATAQA